MSFWKSISRKVEAVPVGNGDVAALKPQGVVEVVAETAALWRLRDQGKIVRAGRPENLTKVARAAAAVAEAARKPADTAFAQRVVERGKASSVADLKRESEAWRAQRDAAAADGASAGAVEEAAAVPEQIEGEADTDGADAEMGTRAKRNRHVKGRSEE